MRLGEEKKEDRKKPQGKNIMCASAMQGGHNKLQPENIYGMPYSIGRP